MSITPDTVTEESAVVVQRQTETSYGAPDDNVITDFVAAVLNQTDCTSAGLTIRIVEAPEIQACNRQWREIDKATNVLSFPAEFPPETGIDYLGDVLICAEVLERESIEQGKQLTDHWAHIVVHGVLHLLGYDHEAEKEAIAMEALEIDILATLGVSDPYQVDSAV